jgi:hypothetical protein
MKLLLLLERKVLNLIQFNIVSMNPKLKLYTHFLHYIITIIRSFYDALVLVERVYNESDVLVLYAVKKNK